MVVDQQLAGLGAAGSQHLRQAGFQVATGVFGAHMDVEIHNDGPVTLLVEREHM